MSECLHFRLIEACVEQTPFPNKIYSPCYGHFIIVVSIVSEVKLKVIITTKPTLFGTFKSTFYGAIAYIS